MRTAIVMMALLAPLSAFAGRGGSTVAIKAAAQSGSADAIVAELERAEFLACLSCIDAVLPLVDHESARVRDAAGWWLGRRGVRSQVISTMQARLAGGDPVAARNAGDVLAAMRDYTTLPALTTYLSQPLDEESGVSVARAVGIIGHPSAVATLQGALASPLSGVRAQAAASLRQLRAPAGKKVAASAPALLPLLGDSDAGVRREAIMTLGFVGQSGGDVSGAVAALSAVATGDASPGVRKAAAWALGEMKDGAARPALQAAQSDSDPLVRSIATAALANLR
ncbi:MAG: lyase domain protein repeat-containing protein [Myxococcales bacterium]|nr:lyase domain protein repeat-containing protein [Myxococcales bacterium]